MNLKDQVKRVLAGWGYEVRRIRKAPPPRFRLGRDPFADIQKVAAQKHHPVIFDVGANVGQTIANFRERFSAPVIHAFEPGAEPYAELSRRYGGVTDVQVNDVALGAEPGVMPYFVNEAGSEMNSLLEPRPEGWGGGHVKGRREVRVETVDGYCRARGIERIDILKTDTQGYDFEVIKGAAGMLARKTIQLIYMEILFSDMYKGQARLDEIYAFLADRGFVLVTFYPFYYWGDKASWTEALFCQPEYRPA